MPANRPPPLERIAFVGEGRVRVLGSGNSCVAVDIGTTLGGRIFENTPLVIQAAERGALPTLDPPGPLTFIKGKQDARKPPFPWKGVSPRLTA